ncbi:MAG: hypothetical protein DRP62_08745, partial [Planctomycetota bacterium]
MSVQFILGRSGTGKTSYCIRSIVEALLRPSQSATGGLILLVPEQATYQAERAVLADKRISGYNRLNVLSFDRLQFLLLGKNTARPALSRIGQQMLIHRILRDNSGKLKVLGPSSAWPGLARQMAETIGELNRYAKTPVDIDRLLGELQKDEQVHRGLEARDMLAGLKFADVGLVFAEYLKSIEGRFLDPDVQLNLARKAVAEAGFIKGAKLWVDGFASFTASELALLAELMKTAAETQIALCLDSANLDLKRPNAKSIDPIGLFEPTERTYTELVELINECKLKLVEPI